jgi:four helix bundle protein
MAGEVRSYRDLKIWRKGIDLVKKVYKAVDRFPKLERYGLADQLRRSSVSVPSNIAEGQARQHTGEFRQFLYTALGSLAEVDTQIVIALELHYLAAEDVATIQNQIVEIRRMTHGLIAKLPN